MTRRTPSTAPGVPPRARLLALAFVSGAAALTYEAVWIRWFRLLFGSTTHASSATLAAFFGGLALGAALFGRRAARSTRPLRAYAWLELGVALSALWVPLAVRLYDPLYPWLYAHLGDERAAFVAVKLALALVALLPASVAIGGTLPLLATALLGGPEALGKLGTRLYALNTLGAAAGAALGALVLPEWIGVTATYAVALGATLAVAGASFALRAHDRPAEAPSRPLARPSAAPAGPRPAAGACALAFASGFGLLAFEVLLIHALGQRYSHSAYTLGFVLLAALVGLAASAALVSLGDGRVAAPALLRVALALTAVLLLLFPWILRLVGPLALVAGLLVFVVGGMVFPLTFRMVAGGHPGRRLGALLAANTLGGILGSAAASFVLLPFVGLWSSLGWLGLVYGVAPLAVAGPLRARAAAAALPALALLGVGLAAADPWRTPSVTLQPGETLLALAEGAHGLVSVVESADGNRRIKIDDLYQFGNSKEALLAERTGHLPLLLHEAPRAVAFVGSATGGVAGAAVLHPVTRIDLIEIVPEVQDLAAAHFAATNRGVHADPRTRLVTEDGRNHLRATTERYDVIVEDCFVPFMPSAAAMYTREHYRDARARLTPDGIFCQWLPVYQFEERTLAIVLATFLAEFPEGTLWRPHLRAHFPVVALVGAAGALPSVPEVERRARELAALGIEDPWVTDPRALWLLYVGPAAAAFAGERPRPHRDAHPYYEFVASRSAPADVASFAYLGWVRLCERAARNSAHATDPFTTRPSSSSRGAWELVRANLAWAGGASAHAHEAWNEAKKHVPADLLVVRDYTFSDVWPR
jgi:spermidine synthase